MNTQISGLSGTPANWQDGDARQVIAFLAQTAVPVVHLDNSLAIRLVNEAFLAFAKASRQDFLGASFATAFPGVAGPTDAEGANRLQLRWQSDAEGGWIGIIEPDHFSDRVHPFRDVLTGLGDRAWLEHSFQQIKAAKEGPIVLICMDLDKFKSVNDTLGHGVGDKLLQKMAERMRRSVREGDVICRMGGDEFAILMQTHDPEATAQDVALRIIDLVGRPFVIDGHQISVGASLGISLVADDEIAVSEALRRADIALYESKRKGRGQVHWYKPEMSEAIDVRRLIETELRAAILRDQFELHFQPQFDSATTDVIGFEALIRWNHPQRGLLSPATFLPICEESGLIVELGAWVLQQSCMAALAWPDHLTVAVNVSPVQFISKGFVESVEQALTTTGLAPQRLDIEITESVMLGHQVDVAERMGRLTAMGITLSLDDFGTGYSSLSYLHSYPFHKVKIDQSFVRGPAAETTGLEIVKAVADIGRSFGMKVLAEGVETADQFTSVTGTGCGLVQGYLIGRPLPQRDVQVFLDTRPYLSEIDHTGNVR